MRDDPIIFAMNKKRVLLLNLKMNYVHFNVTCICFKTYEEIYDDDYNNE